MEDKTARSGPADTGRPDDAKPGIKPEDVKVSSPKTPDRSRDRARNDDNGALGRDVQAKIGQHLRTMYDDVVRQGVPDRFTDLLSRLDRRDEGTETS